MVHCSVVYKETRSKGTGIGQTRQHQSPHQVQGPGLRTDQGRGGRHTPFFDGYRPQFYFRTTDVTGVAHLPEGVEMVMPSDNIDMEVELILPSPLKRSQVRFREGGRTVGAGVVAALKSSRESKSIILLLKAVNWNKNCFEDFK